MMMMIRPSLAWLGKQALAAHCVNVARPLGRSSQSLFSSSFSTIPLIFTIVVLPPAHRTDTFLFAAHHCAFKSNLETARLSSMC